MSKNNNEFKTSPFMVKLKKLLTADSVGMLVLRIVILLAIPYAYLMLCGLIFEKVLKMYTSFASNFTFFTLIILFIIAVILIVFSIKWYLESKKSKKGKKK